MKTDNELIGEFMGFAVVNKMPQAGIPESTFILEKNLKYHKSWDWLMPVVEKIAEYRLAHPYETAKVCKLRVVVKKEALYSRVIEFIKWYNNEIH